MQNSAARESGARLPPVPRNWTAKSFSGSPTLLFLCDLSEVSSLRLTSMRYLLALVAALLSSLSLTAETSVWKVSRGGRSLYLGGTCHYLRAADMPLPPEFDIAFADSKTICFETDMAKLQSPDTQAALAAQAMYTDGTTLDTVLTPEAWKATTAWCTKNHLPAAQLKTLKPWMLMMTITSLELQRYGFTAEGVDVQMQAKGAAAGKRFGELESVEQQIEFITHLGEGAESALIVATFADIDRVPKLLAEMVSAWRTGDLSQIDKLMSDEMRTKFPSVYSSLIVRRNKAWLPKIEAMLATEPKEFILVGAAHLAGKDGLIEALRKKGCSVEPVKAP